MKVATNHTSYFIKVTMSDKCEDTELPARIRGQHFKSFIAYFKGHQLKKKKKILTFDFGNGANSKINCDMKSIQLMWRMKEMSCRCISAILINTSNSIMETIMFC